MLASRPSRARPIRSHALIHLESLGWIDAFGRGHLLSSAGGERVWNAYRATQGAPCVAAGSRFRTAEAQSPIDPAHVAYGPWLRSRRPVETVRVQRSLIQFWVWSIALVGLAWPWISKLPIGRLPGDIHDRPAGLQGVLSLDHHGHHQRANLGDPDVLQEVSDAA